MVFQCHFSCIIVASAPTYAFLELFTSIQRNILSKPLTAFPHKYCQNNGQRSERNKPCHNGYHQFSERILTESGDRTSDSYSQVLDATD